MRRRMLGWIVVCCLVSLVLASFQIAGSEFLRACVGVPSQGFITYWPVVDVTVNINQVIGINNMSLGLQIDREWKAWLDNPTMRGLVRNADIRIIRFFDFSPSATPLMPCIYWNETNQTGTWDWTNVDNFVQAIFADGAEPLVCLGWANNKTKDYIPSGMVIDSLTGLPYSNSYANYCSEWVRHFKEKSLPVRFYEIFNEPGAYFGAYNKNLTKLEYYKKVWNCCAKAMRAIDPDVLLSFDYIMWKKVLDYWLISDGENVDFLDFHKYDSPLPNGQPCLNDSELLERAETYKFETDDARYGVDDARQIWFNARGHTLPVICSESNLNSAYENGTDPRIQRTIGATWTALVLREAVLNGLRFYTYCNLASNRSQVAPSGGIGMGMIDFETNKPWYTYYVYQLLGNHLAVTDKIVESTSSSDDIRVLSWIHNKSPCVFIICKVDQPRTIFLHGLGSPLSAIKIDDTIPWQNASLSAYTLNPGESLRTNGYTITLLEIAQ